MSSGHRSSQRVRLAVRRNRRRLELYRKLRQDPGHGVRWCWWYAGFTMRLAREVVQQQPLTEAEIFELDVLSDIYALPEVARVA